MKPQKYNRFRIYLYLEYKKYRSALSRILGGFTVILLLLCGCAMLYQRYHTQNQEKDVIHIGIVSDPDEPYLDWMIQTIENMEGLKTACTFTSVTEEEGKKGLQTGEYTALFLIPHNYVRSLIDGEEAILRIQFGQGQTTVASYLVRALGDAASRIMIHTQAGIYAMDDYYRENQIPRRLPDERSLNIRYLQKILNRKQIFSLEKVPGGTGNLTHYCAAAILFALLSLGLTCPEILRPEARALRDKLYLSGLSDWQRILAKECALLLTFGSVYLVLVLLLAAAVPWIPILASALQIPSASAPVMALAAAARLLALASVLCVVCGWILCIYEIAKETISSILLLFLSMITCSFLSGYFYPLSYLPSGIQRLSCLLPTGVMLQYSEHILNGIWHTSDLLALSGYSLILYLAVVGLSRTGLTVTDPWKSLITRRISH